jgi:hypothetical protein
MGCGASKCLGAYWGMLHRSAIVTIGRKAPEFGYAVADFSPFRLLEETHGWPVS